MRRFAVVAVAAFTLVGPMALAGQAEGPRFFFDRGIDAVSFWDRHPSATELVRTSVIFFADERGSTPAESTLTFLGFSEDTYAWDGTAWQLVSTVFALAHSQDGDLINYTIGPGGRTITASATAELRECTPWPNCTPLGPVQIQASWSAIGPSGTGGYRVPDWSGSGCQIDFIAGSTVSLSASVAVTIDGVAPQGDPFFSGIEKFHNVEVNFCTPGS